MPRNPTEKIWQNSSQHELFYDINILLSSLQEFARWKKDLSMKIFKGGLKSEGIFSLVKSSNCYPQLFNLLEPFVNHVIPLLVNKKLSKGISTKNLFPASLTLWLLEKILFHLRKWDCISDSTNAEIHHLHKHNLNFPSKWKLW